jgi:Y-X(10)_GDL-associated radical SAM protein
MALPRRAITASDQAARRPVHVVWEITLACDLKCAHCGSRAGPKRANELSTEECRDLVPRLAALGARHITLIGGEAYLRRDWLEIVRAIRAAGLDCTLQSGGLHLTPARIEQAAAAGLQGIGISIDGLAPLHDRLRGVSGSFDAAFAALDAARSRGMKISANTQITAPILSELREVFERLVAAGVEGWQVQLTVAMGRAADHPELLLQPYQLLTLMPMLAELYVEGLGRGLLMQPGNNVGYFGPYESLLRGSIDERLYWQGCSAGQNGIGIEADGVIKGCPSLPTATYAGGNVRDSSLEELWTSAPKIRFREGRTPMWGFCGTCYYADVCEGGCTWTSHSLLGKPGNNPYCHHRTLELQRRGLRERIAQVERAPGQSFDHGRFELILEPISADSPPIVTGDPSMEAARQELPRSRRRRRLEPCRGCNRHVFAGTTQCPHCGGDIEVLATRYARSVRMARSAYAKLAALLGA